MGDSEKAVMESKVALKAAEQKVESAKVGGQKAKADERENKAGVKRVGKREIIEDEATEGKGDVSMLSKGVLQVDKIGGKKGNFVYINGRSVGLSNKLNDFASLAAKMSVYEAVLAKLTAKLPTTTKHQKTLKVLPPQWQGN